MNRYSTSDVARKLGIHPDTLAHYIETRKVPPPEIVRVGAKTIHIWTEAEIEYVRQLLPKIPNGRKTRYKKKQSAPSSQQSAKAKGKTKSKKKK
ncbi:MAG TPA: hypothetical protein VFW31_01350 [Candidatus Angelobacter sp.]|nr:hypothetical protein [Candidatus Angelobacter sp.]